MLSRPAQGARGSRRKGLQRRKSLQPHGEGRQRQARGAEAPPAECLWSLQPGEALATQRRHRRLRRAGQRPIPQRKARRCVSNGQSRGAKHDDALATANRAARSTTMR